jgi:predicted RNA-binding Zn-ribbon protein involved in translation (DUF1610 family)
MIPNVKCDQCGQSATIMRCTPVCENKGPIADEQFRQSVNEISCKIDCPRCGERIQLMASLST